LRKLLALVVCVAAFAGHAAALPSNPGNVKLEIYSNWPEARTFLGCLNCAATDPTSVWSPTSRYGWANPDGVWSRPAFRHANYRHLVCDLPLTAAPPAVFDQHFDFYYILSVDTVRRDSICTLTMLKDGCEAVRVLCAGKSAAGVPAVGWIGKNVDPH
jgi:hypothetical protein